MFHHGKVSWKERSLAPYLLRATKWQFYIGKKEKKPGFLCLLRWYSFACWLSFGFFGSSIFILVRGDERHYKGNHRNVIPQMLNKVFLMMQTRPCCIPNPRWAAQSARGAGRAGRVGLAGAGPPPFPAQQCRARGAQRDAADTAPLGKGTVR